MFKQLVFLFSLGVIALSACSTPRGSAKASLENALLWKISHPDLKNESYLFGTIHIITSEDYFLPAGMDIAMEKADKFVFEIDMKEMTDIGAQMSLISKAFMKDGVRLKDLVSQEDYAKIKEHFEGVGLPMMMLDRIKPLFLTVFASSEISPGDLSTGDLMSYEMELYEFAQEREKETGGLETIEFQMSIFDEIPYEAQAEMLVESIGAEEGDMLQQMIEVYKSQDIDALYQTIGDDEHGTGEYEDILVKERNQQWISGIREHMESGPVLFAVGAGHLGGKHGVIRLLRKARFTVTPVLEEGDRATKKF